MRPEVNGIIPSSYHTKHIKTRHSFIKEKIEEGEVEVQHCPTQLMWTDILNRPEQSMKYYQDKSAQMNVPIAYNEEVKHK